MEALIEQLKARGFVDQRRGESVWRAQPHGWDMVMNLTGSENIVVVVQQNGAGQIERWLPGDVTIEQVESFIARARRIITEWDTMEVSFQGGTE